MNMEERIGAAVQACWGQAEWQDGSTEGADAIKQLLRDVLEEVKPERAGMSVLNEYDRGYTIARNTAIDEMESNVKRLGLQL